MSHSNGSALSPPDALKTRIITHMNADHARSLALFQRHYNRIPQSHACTAKLDDITTTHLILSSTFGRTYIPLEPPMASLSEARGRLVAMHQECLAALDESDTIVKSWVPHTTGAWHVALFVVCCVVFVSFSTRANFKPDSWMYAFWSLNGAWPGLAVFCSAIQPYLITFMVVVHGAEATNMARTRLRKHGVAMFSWLWWTWMVDCFVDGVSAFARFDILVKGMEEAKKKNEKH